MKIIRKKELMKSLKDGRERLEATNKEKADWKRWLTMAENRIKELEAEVEEIKKDGVMSQIMPLTKDMSHKEIELCLDVSFTTLINYASSYLGVRINNLEYNVYTEKEDCGIYFFGLPVSNIDIKFDKRDYKPTKVSNEKK